jgi:hypothetical protein
MCNVYLVKRFNHVTLAKRRRLLEENLVPILDESAENAPYIIDYFKEGDWLVEYRDSDKPLYVYKVKSYCYKPHLHLYVKHFIEAENIYKLDKSYVSADTHILLSRANHLEALPRYVCDMCVSYQDKVNTDPDEKIKHLIFLLELNRNTLNKAGKELLNDLGNGKLTSATLGAISSKRPSPKQTVRRTKIISPMELVDPSKIDGAISKAALEAYMQKHGGKFPAVKEFEKLIKRFRTTSGRRR